MMLRNERTLSRLAKIFSVLFLNGMSTLAMASDHIPRNFQSGRIGINNAELALKMGKLSHFDKQEAAVLQMKKLVPEVIFDSVEFTTLEMIDFSCRDDEWERAAKFLRLSMYLKDDKLIQIAHKEAESSLESLQKVSKARAWDYYLTLAMYKTWSARSLFKCGNILEEVRTLNTAMDYLDEAESSLKEIRSADLSMFKRFVNRKIDKLSEEQLKTMAESATVATIFWGEEELSGPVNKISETKTRLKKEYLRSLSFDERERLGISTESDLDNVLNIYRGRQVKKLFKDMTLSLKEKKRIIKAQNTLDNYYRLKEMRLILPDSERVLEDGGFLDLAEFVDVYRFNGRNEIEIKDNIMKRIERERAKIEATFETIKKAIKTLETIKKAVKTLKSQR